MVCAQKISSDTFVCMVAFSDTSSEGAGAVYLEGAEHVCVSVGLSSRRKELHIVPCIVLLFGKLAVWCVLVTLVQSPCSRRGGRHHRQQETRFVSLGWGDCQFWCFATNCSQCILSGEKGAPTPTFLAGWGIKVLENG